MSHLLCAFTLGTQLKHQYDIYFCKIHWVVQEILSVYIFAILVTAEAAILDGQFV